MTSFSFALMRGPWGQFLTLRHFQFFTTEARRHTEVKTLMRSVERGKGVTH